MLSEPNSSKKIARNPKRKNPFNDRRCRRNRHFPNLKSEMALLTSSDAVEFLRVGALACPAHVTPAKTWPICAGVARSAILRVPSQSKIRTMPTQPSEFSAPNATRVPSTSIAAAPQNHGGSPQPRPEIPKQPSSTIVILNNTSAGPCKKHLESKSKK